MMQLNTGLPRSHTPLTPFSHPHFCVGPDADCQQISGNTNCRVKKNKNCLVPSVLGRQPSHVNTEGQIGRELAVEPIWPRWWGGHQGGEEEKQQDRSQLHVTDNFSPPPGILSPPCWIISALTLRCTSWWDDCSNVLSLKMPHHC